MFEPGPGPHLNTNLILSEEIIILVFVFLDPDDTRWVGMWWGGFLVCGILLILVAVPFFAFPKTLLKEKEKIRLMEKSKPEGERKISKSQCETETKTYGKDVKGKKKKKVFSEFRGQVLCVGSAVFII